jgi:hypothetical protein
MEFGQGVVGHRKSRPCKPNQDIIRHSEHQLQHTNDYRVSSTNTLVCLITGKS